MSREHMDMGMSAIVSLEIRRAFLHPRRTQGQLVGWKGFLWAKVYCKNRRAPGKLLLRTSPEAFEFPAFDWPEKFSEDFGTEGLFCVHKINYQAFNI